MPITGSVAGTLLDDDFFHGPPVMPLVIVQPRIVVAGCLPFPIIVLAFGNVLIISWSRCRFMITREDLEKLLPASSFRFSLSAAVDFSGGAVSRLPDRSRRLLSKGSCDPLLVDLADESVDDGTSIVVVEDCERSLRYKGMTGSRN